MHAVRHSPRLQARKPVTKGAGSSKPSSSSRKPAKSIRSRGELWSGALSPVEEGGEGSCHPVDDNDSGMEGHPSTFLYVLKFYSDYLLSYPTPEVEEQCSSQWSTQPVGRLERPMTCGADALTISKMTKLDVVEVQRSLDTLVNEGYAWYNNDREGYSFDHTKMINSEYTKALASIPSFDIPPDFYAVPGNAKVQETEVISPGGTAQEKDYTQLETGARTPTVTLSDVIWDVIKDITCHVSAMYLPVITDHQLWNMFGQVDRASMHRALTGLVEDGEIISPTGGSYKFNTQRVLPRSLVYGKLECLSLKCTDAKCMTMCHVLLF